MVFDCCHSGTICDLPYHYDVVNDRMKHTVQDDEGCENKQIYKISGSRDDQVSLSMYDYEFGKMKGACTNALIRTLDESGFDITMKELVMKMNKWMVKNGSEQCPTYATSDPSTLEHNMKDVFSVNVKSSGVVESCETCVELEKMVETMRKEAEELKSENAKLEKMNRDLRAENTRIQQSLTDANSRYNYCNNMLQRYKRTVNYLQRRVQYLTQLLRRRR